MIHPTFGRFVTSSTSVKWPGKTVRLFHRHSQSASPDPTPRPDRAMFSGRRQTSLIILMEHVEFVREVYHGRLWRELQMRNAAHCLFPRLCLPLFSASCSASRLESPVFKCFSLWLFPNGQEQHDSVGLIDLAIMFKGKRGSVRAKWTACFLDEKGEPSLHLPYCYPLAPMQ